ncbi:nucleoside diphosphate kinase, partial [Salpingoeca rosetta]
MVLEQTLAIIKPDAVHRSYEILDDIVARGFTILRKRRVRISPEQANEFYAEHYGKEFFPRLIGFMSSGPIMVLVLAKADAITSWREALGPTSSEKARDTAPASLRAKYGTDNTRNALHGSDSLVSAMREIKFFFPETPVASSSDAGEAREYLEKQVNPTLIRGLTALCK